MSLFRKLQRRAANGTPIKVGVIGAGKFGSMFLSQIPRIPGIEVVGVADLNIAAAQSNLTLIGWPEEKFLAPSLDAALASGAAHVTQNAMALIARPEIEVIVDCTGNPVVAIEHIVAAFEHGKHVVSATVEADAVCGVVLADLARRHGVLYSMAYGDQPAMVCELVDWARVCGFKVAAAGRGHKWKDEFRYSTPDTIWNYWGLTAEQAERGRLNPKMFNSFLDGTKPAIESAAIANACNLAVPDHGLTFPTGSMDDIANLMRPASAGGALAQSGMVEVINSMGPDGQEVPYHIRQGVWVCVEASNDYQRNCFEEYLVVTDDSGYYTTVFKRWHLIGLELGMSVASVAERGETTGTPQVFNGDVVAIAKRPLKAGELLDGEGGFTVAGGLRPAAQSVAMGAIPLGLASDLKLKRDVAVDQILTRDDVDLDESLLATRLRYEAEALVKPQD